MIHGDTTYQRRLAWTHWKVRDNNPRKSASKAARRAARREVRRSLEETNHA